MVMVMVVTGRGQRRGRRVLQFAAVVHGHAGDRRVPSGGSRRSSRGRRRACARFAGVHFV